MRHHLRAKHGQQAVESTSARLARYGGAVFGLLLVLTTVINNDALWIKLVAIGLFSVLVIGILRDGLRLWRESREADIEAEAAAEEAPEIDARLAEFEDWDVDGFDSSRFESSQFESGQSVSAAELEPTLPGRGGAPSDRASRSVGSPSTGSRRTDAPSSDGPRVAWVDLDLPASKPAASREAPIDETRLDDAVAPEPSVDPAYAIADSQLGGSELDETIVPSPRRAAPRPAVESATRDDDQTIVRFSTTSRPARAAVPGGGGDIDGDVTMQPRRKRATAPGLQLDVLDLVDGEVELRLVAEDGRQQGESSMRVPLEEALRFAEALRGFPRDANDRRDVSLGPCDVASDAGGGIRVVAFSRQGDVQLFLTLWPGSSSRSADTASLAFAARPGDFTRFTAALASAPLDPGASVELRRIESA